MDEISIFFRELYFILRFHEFSWMDFHPTQIASNAHHAQKWMKKNMKTRSQNQSWALLMNRADFHVDH